MDGKRQRVGGNWEGERRRWESNPRITVLQTDTTKSQVPENNGTYESTEQPLTPQLTPEDPKQGQIESTALPPDVAEIVAAWPRLPEHIKAAIKALVQTDSGGRD